MEKRKWIDTHVHVSNYRPDGAERGDSLDALLEVLDCSGADLRFIISCDLPWIGRMMQDASQVLEGNWFIYDLVRRALDRLPQNRILAGTDWTTRVGSLFCHTARYSG